MHVKLKPRHLVVALLTSVCVAGQPSEPPSIECSHKAGGHVVHVRIEIGPFDPSRHVIRSIRPFGARCTEVDGNSRPLGTDCDAPRTEIRGIRVTLDGVELTVPRELYEDCFDASPGNLAVVRLADDAKSAFLFFWGSDAAGSYEVIWVFRADGRHSRLSCGEYSDQTFINFDSAFLTSTGPE